jgi:hypothetical protein
MRHFGKRNRSGATSATRNAIHWSTEVSTKIEPIDNELLFAIAERARARRAQGVVPERPAIPMAAVVAAGALPLVRRGERCPSCEQIVNQLELEESTPAQCRACREVIAEKAAMLKKRIERIPPAYGGDPPWTRERPPPFLPAPAVRMGLEWLASRAPRLSIFGEHTGSGKSTLAGFLAIVDAHDGRGWEWVHAADLVPDHEFPDQAKEAARVVATAPRVIVDGVGTEFRGHDPKSGWAARKKEWVHRLFYRAHESRNQRYIFTFDMGIDRVIERYDDPSILRRVAPDDGKTVIELYRTDKLRIAKGAR